MIKSRIVLSESNRFYRTVDVMSRQKVFFHDGRGRKYTARKKEREKKSQTKTTKLHIEAKIFSFFSSTAKTAARAEKKKREKKKEGGGLVVAGYW